MWLWNHHKAPGPDNIPGRLMWLWNHHKAPGPDNIPGRLMWLWNHHKAPGPDNIPGRLMWLWNHHKAPGPDNIPGRLMWLWNHHKAPGPDNIPGRLMWLWNHHKAPGPDNIPGRLLKEGAIELSPIFTLLFNSTLHQGKIPSPWKQAHVAPVHKKNSRHDPANYRPISLTSVTCKIIEHIIYSQVINHLDSNGILTDKQFGFRKRHSCETQLLITVQDLAINSRSMR